MTVESKESVNTRDMQPEKIIGAVRNDDELSYVIKWQDTSTVEVINAEDVKNRWPELIIEYYEERLINEKP